MTNVKKLPDFSDDKAYAVISRLFSIFDHTSKSYDVPRAFPSRGVALRSVMDAIAQEGTVFQKHPEQFSLFCIGEFDSSTGKITPLSVPELIANFWELAK